jgi:murein DD-endopeptidase MepM/ murein hydrolase activator NlpD
MNPIVNLLMKKVTWILRLLAASSLILSACRPIPDINSPDPTKTAAPPPQTPTPSGPTATPLPVRSGYLPGELVNYTAQSGDTLPALAERFNTSIEEIRIANPVIPKDATTMPPGMPMQIPIYFRNFWGTPYKILPDSRFVNGPSAVDFDIVEFSARYNGWINNYVEYAAEENRTGPEIIELVAKNYSINPQLLLALSEYLSGALTRPTLPEASADYPLQFRSSLNKGFYRQLLWTANKLNNGYYAWRTGDLLELELPDNTLERPDPWQNAATVSLQYLFSVIMTIDQYNLATSPEGFGNTWKQLYGDPWIENQPHIPGSLTQPGLLLPYPAGQVWAYTGGPHNAWGSGIPMAAIDFAPASDLSGCYTSNEWTTAMADGIITRSEPGFLTLDLDMDNDERTGWVIFYLHIEGREIIPAGTIVSAGDPLGHPSCDGGNSTGTHIHVARKFNGEWLIADSEIPFVVEGWRVKNGQNPYEGTLERFEKIINACECATLDTNLQATGNYDGVPTTPLPTPTP